MFSLSTTVSNLRVKDGFSYGSVRGSKDGRDRVQVGMTPKYDLVIGLSGASVT
jgi:hypothetical protein